MKSDNISHSSNVSLTTDTESKSKTSSFSSINMTNLTNNLLKSCDWLNDLLELHYFAYNSCNSLTIYSYKYLTSQKKIFVATKENNVKEIFFDLVLGDETQTAESVMLSTQSSLSSGNSNPNMRHPSSTTEEPVNIDSSRKTSVACTETKSNMSIFECDGSFLTPVYKIHKLSKIKGAFIPTF